MRTYKEIVKNYILIYTYMTTIYYDAIMGLKQEMSWHCTMNPVE